MKVLVVRFSSIGDIILTTPVVRCLANQANAEVHYLTKNAFRAILDQNPYISRVHAIREKTSEVIDQLRKADFDQVIDLHHNLRSSMLKKQLRKPSRAFHKINIEKWLKVNLKVDILPARHIVDRYLDTVSHLGIENDGHGLDYFISPDDQDRPAAFMDRYKLKKFVCLSVGAAHLTKCLTTEQLARICLNVDVPVVLLGGVNEGERGETIRQKGGDHVFNFCGKLSLNQTAAFIDRAELLISHDTGVMHMGAALEKRIISIWGNTIPGFGMAPYYGDSEIWQQQFETHGLRCRPCSKIGYEACPKGHFKCIRLISAERIASTVRKQLAH